MESFVSEPIQPSEEVVDGSPPSNRGDREPVLILVIGSQTGITAMIYTLVRLGFAQRHEWSKPQIDPNSGKWMCILTKLCQCGLVLTTENLGVLRLKVL